VLTTIGDPNRIMGAIIPPIMAINGIFEIAEFASKKNIQARVTIAVTDSTPRLIAMVIGAVIIAIQDVVATIFISYYLNSL
jgi:hypothetical protein